MALSLASVVKLGPNPASAQRSSPISFQGCRNCFISCQRFECVRPNRASGGRERATHFLSKDAGERDRTENANCLSGGNSRLVSESGRAVEKAWRIHSTGGKEEEGQTSDVEKAPLKLVWFKHDLRIDDHPGLHSLEQGKSSIPLFIFDPFIISALPASLLPPLHAGVVALRKHLLALGSNLVIRTGQSSSIISSLVGEFGVTEVVSEEEVEHIWLSRLRSISRSLPANSKVITWNTPLFPVPEAGIPEDYREYMKIRGKNLSPLGRPSSVPPLPPGLDAGKLPSLEEVLAMAGMNERGKADGGSGEDDVVRFSEHATRSGEESAASTLEGYLRIQEPTGRLDWQRMYRDVFEAESSPHSSFPLFFSNALSLGLLSPRRILFNTLKYEKERGGGRISPFGLSTFTARAAVFSVELADWYLQLSRLVLKNESIQSEGQERSQVGQRGDNAVIPSTKTRFWRWRGALIQYAVAGGVQGGEDEEGKEEAEVGNDTEVGSGRQGKRDEPAVVFVHGFGAFWQHFCRNMEIWFPQSAVVVGKADGSAESETLKGGGEWSQVGGPSPSRVWAITLPGFGRSEKPFIPYTQYVWQDVVRDFLTEVVKQPAILAGNSIGGYTAASVAADSPNLVASLVLLNSAGKIVPNYIPPSKGHDRQKKKGEGPPRAVAWVFSRLLLSYLQSNTRSILKRCYPVHPEAADDWLLSEITRAGNDPGSAQVVESALYLPSPRPLNHLIDIYGGPVLVLQGRLDPLNDAVGRANLLKAACPGVAVQFVNAGHCPHDEAPEAVNAAISSWARATWCSTSDQKLQDLSEKDVKSGQEPSDVLDIMKEEGELLIYSSEKE